MKIKKGILFVLISMFLISLVFCGRYCMRYDRAVQNTARAEAYHEQLEQEDSDRAANNWHYDADLSEYYSSQRRQSQENIQRAEEKIWEQEDIEKTLATNAFRSAGITVVLFIVTCIFYVKAMKKRKHYKNY
jgi:Flp pilus assembly protein TadB